MKTLVVDIEQAFVDYVAEANEHEDEPLTEKEIERLKDFVLYIENSIESE